jgi:16S rRNA G1207 methylase RsmC
MFQAFADQLRQLGKADLQVLDIGSGPAFLAEYLLGVLPHLRLSLLDFSQPMHELASIRLREHVAQVQFLQRNFKDADWVRELGTFDVVVTNQAVHELRHKKHALALHTQAASILVAGGCYLVCDHFCGAGGMSNDQLYMSIDEQYQALAGAGFESVEQLHQAGTLVMHRAV